MIQIPNITNKLAEGEINIIFTKNRKMNKIALTSLLWAMIAIFLVACGGESNKVMEEARKTLPTKESGDISPSAPAPVTGGAVAVPHYQCPNNCAGGVGEAAGACPVCGTTLAHNQAYHNQPNSAPTPINETVTPPPPASSPAQNAAGVYHYICSNGCSGGAGSAVACGSCGSMLSHNQAYHN